MKLRNLLIPAVLALTFVVGCSGGNAMVGTWKLEVSEDMQKMMPKDFKPPTMEFKGDGTFDAKIEAGGKTSTSTGTYTLQDKTLTVTMVTEDGKPSANKKAETATLADDMKSFPMPGGMGKMVKQ